MGKTIRLTEEQIRRFFGEGFGRKLIGEANLRNVDGMRPQVIKTPEVNFDDATMPKKYAKTLGHVFAPGDNGDDDMFFTNQDYIPREVVGDVDMPGYGGAIAKMADFGQSNLTTKNAVYGNNESEQLLKRIREIFDKEILAQGKGSTMNILDVLKIMHKIKNTKANADGSNKKDENGNEITEDEAVQFLNSLSIDYILSNYITVNAPDYVFWRLKNLSEQEIDSIEKTYGRDFHNFGQRCDGCGTSKWYTTIIRDEHDDAHINFEYMGSAAAQNNTGHAIVKEGAREAKEYPVPLQIHHMNENPGDNSPLNLSCLCANCHALTGSYGRQKSNLDDKAFEILKQNTTTDDGSLNGFLKDDEVNRIANAIKNGKFETRTVADRLTGAGLEKSNLDEFTFDPENRNLQANVSSFGIPNPEEFIKKFNEMFVSVYNEGVDEFNKFNQKRLKESRRITESSEFTDDRISTPGEESDSAIGDLEFYYTVSASDSGNIVLQLYCGKKPYIFSAFRNNGVPLTRMYYENDANKPKAIAYIRNRIFSASLNAAKEFYKGKMSNWLENAPLWAKNSNDNMSNNALTKLSSTSEKDRKKAAALFQHKGSDDNVEMTRDAKAKKHANQKANYSESELSTLANILIGTDTMVNNIIEKNTGNFSQALFDFMLEKRKEGYGKQYDTLTKKSDRLGFMKSLLRGGGFYEERPQTIK